MYINKKIFKVLQSVPSPLEEIAFHDDNPNFLFKSLDAVIRFAFILVENKAVFLSLHEFLCGRTAVRRVVWSSRYVVALGQYDPFLVLNTPINLMNGIMYSGHDYI